MNQIGLICSFLYTNIQSFVYTLNTITRTWLRSCPFSAWPILKYGGFEQNLFKASQQAFLEKFRIPRNVRRLLMRITQTRDKSITQYMLDKPLKDLKSFKDLGVAISKDLSWDNLISITVNKANNLLGLIKCSVSTTHVNVFSTLYLSLVRPILEYAVPVWCPYLVKDIRALESIQRRASRLALNQHKGEMPYVCRSL